MTYQTTRSTYQPLTRLPLSFIPNPKAEYDDLWPENPFCYNDLVDDTLLPSWSYVGDLTVDNLIATEDYYNFLLPLARHRNPEVTKWVLVRMDAELEALARLPDADFPAFEADHPPSRKELNRWLLKHDKYGLHTIHQNTIALLRSTIDDMLEYEIPRHEELFGDRLRITNMERCMSEDVRRRQQAHLLERTREAKENNLVD